MGVLDIPPEVAEHALGFATPQAVASFSQTCRIARTIVYNEEQHLWRRLYLLAPFDYPQQHDMQTEGSSSEVGADSGTRFNWKSELQKRVQAARVVRAFPDVSSDEKVQALTVLVEAVWNASPMQRELEDKEEESQDLIWLASLLQHDDSMSNFLRLAGDSGHDEEAPAQLLYQLRAYTGHSLPKGLGSDFASRRTEARCYVYNLENYRQENHWGPYLHDGSQHVNWRHIDAAMTVVSTNLDELDTMHRWVPVRPPRSLQSARALSAPPSVDSDERDWAGVQGLWRRFVCFMDYRDLFAFNFSSTHDGPLNPAFFDDPGFHEAIRLIEIKLRVTKFERNPHSLRPTICFAGTSRGSGGQRARVKGRVFMNVDGNIRWRFVSMHDGHTRWESEGIQVGNVGCAQGVVGTWTGADHEHGDPAGPFWFWKVSGDVEEASDVDLDQLDF